MGAHFEYTLNDLMDEEAFAASTGSNHVNYTPEGKAMPLKTTGATNPEPQRSISTWTYSDILQGSANIAPQGAILGVFNESLSSDLAGILSTEEGGADGLLGHRKNYTPDDILAAAKNAPQGATDVNGVVNDALQAGQGVPGGTNVRTEPSHNNGMITVADVKNGAGTTTTVAQSIAGSIQQLYDAAKAEGIIMAGWGYRSYERQKELRVINGCPDVFTAPASSCRVPTARPGTSKHETGLAIDFTQNGSTLTRASSGFQWMVANAAKYGLKNLPSEPWHWSTTGQ